MHAKMLAHGIRRNPMDHDIRVEWVLDCWIGTSTLWLRPTRGLTHSALSRLLSSEVLQTTL
jgi:hypothetical protein